MEWTWSGVFAMKSDESGVCESENENENYIKVFFLNDVCMHAGNDVCMWV